MGSMMGGGGMMRGMSGGAAPWVMGGFAVIDLGAGLALLIAGAPSRRFE